MTEEQILLIGTAAGIGIVHTLIGPDHYLPFITLARARKWSLARTLGVTLASGLGHVAGSIGLGALGLGLGWAVGGLERFESARGATAGWLLLAFGLMYFVWGLRQALTGRPHSHLHAHADGTLHEHQHVHRLNHAHPHESPSANRKKLLGGATAWTLFVVFVLGPCEPLIPLLMYPAASGNALGVVAVVAVFAAATLLTMVSLVLVGRAGLTLLPDGRWERWSHAVAGALVAVCGLAIQLGL
ncbi:MAG: sulfite exporter TauE/SafE family protein [Deltaproteobacteria bacterium]|nr:sulfite exporter TauE/SafE family protein [Deltaproteobacteria bacterium]